MAAEEGGSCHPLWGHTVSRDPQKQRPPSSSDRDPQSSVREGRKSGKLRRGAGRRVFHQSAKLERAGGPQPHPGGHSGGCRPRSPARGPHGAHPDELLEAFVPGQQVLVLLERLGVLAAELGVGFAQLLRARARELGSGKDEGTSVRASPSSNPVTSQSLASPPQSIPLSWEPILSPMSPKILTHPPPVS